MDQAVPAADTNPSDSGRSFSMLAAVVALVALVILALRLVPHYTNLPAWDDAYMFIRYARQLQATGAVAWNPDGVPTYGLTSLLYLAVVLPLDRLLPNNPTLALILACTLPGILFLVLLAGGVYRLIDLPRAPGLLVTSTVIGFVLIRTEIPTFFANGMDTMLSMLYVLAYTLAIIRWERSAGGIWLPLALGAIGYLVRPDVLLITIGTPILALFWVRSGALRRDLAILVTGTVAATLLIAGACWLVFGTPVPLSFFAKSTGIYGPAIREFYRSIGWIQAVNFVLSVLPFLVLIGLGRPFTRPALRLEPALLLVTVAYGSYFTFSVTQIMGNQSRFYFPLLPIIVVLATLAFGRLIRVWTSQQAEGRRLSRFQRVAPRAIMLLLALDFVTFAATSYATSYYPLSEPFTGVRPIEPRLARLAGILDHEWPGLYQISQLPDDIALAATEVGLPGVLSPGKTLIDLAGLNTRAISTGQQTPRQAIEELRPDYIFLPHPAYVEMIDDILASPVIQREYLHLSSECLDGRLAIAILRSSPRYPELVQAVSHRRAPGSDLHRSC